MKQIVFSFSVQIGVYSSSSSEIEEIYFDFRKQRFLFSEAGDTFNKLSYPTKESFAQYLKSSGYGTEAKVSAAVDKWGRNA
jgi:manganese-transporting P-type ATPase